VRSVISGSLVIWSFLFFTKINISLALIHGFTNYELFGHTKVPKGSLWKCRRFVWETDKPLQTKINHNSFFLKKMSIFRESHRMAGNVARYEKNFWKCSFGSYDPILKSYMIGYGLKAFFSKFRLWGETQFLGEKFIFFQKLTFFTKSIFTINP